MPKNQNSAAIQPETSPPKTIFDVQFESFDSVDEHVSQAEINLIEQYFPDLLNLLKGTTQ